MRPQDRTPSLNRRLGRFETLESRYTLSADPIGSLLPLPQSSPADDSHRTGALLLDSNGENLTLEFLDNSGTHVRYNAGAGWIERSGVTSIQINTFATIPFLADWQRGLGQTFMQPTGNGKLTIIGSAGNDQIQVGNKSYMGSPLINDADWNLKFGQVSVLHNFRNITVDAGAGNDQVTVVGCPTMIGPGIAHLDLQGGDGNDTFAISQSFNIEGTDIALYGGGGINSATLGACLNVTHFVSDVMLSVEQPYVSLLMIGPPTLVDWRFNAGIKLYDHVFSNFTFDGQIHLWDANHELSAQEAAQYGAAPLFGTSFEFHQPTPPAADDGDSTDTTSDGTTLAPESTQVAFYMAAQSVTGETHERPRQTPYREPEASA